MKIGDKYKDLDGYIVMITHIYRTDVYFAYEEKDTYTGYCKELSLDEMEFEKLFNPICHDKE